MYDNDLNFLLQNPNILTALRPRHGENIAEKSITVCSGLDMVNINLTHFVFANKEDADVCIFEINNRIDPIFGLTSGSKIGLNICVKLGSQG